MELIAQGEGHLGQRLAKATAAVFDRHDGPLLVVGVDTRLTRAHAEAALAQLAARRRRRVRPGARRRLLPGRARAAGAGAVRDRPAAWGGPEVLERTLRAAREAGLATALLDPERDLDTPADAQHMLDDPELGALRPPQPRERRGADARRGGGAARPARPPRRAGRPLRGDRGRRRLARRHRRARRRPPARTASHARRRRPRGADERRRGGSPRRPDRLPPRRHAPAATAHVARSRPRRPTAATSRSASTAATSSRACSAPGTPGSGGSASTTATRRSGCGAPPSTRSAATASCRSWTTTTSCGGSRGGFRTACLPGPVVTSARRWRALGIPRTVLSWVVIRWLFIAGVPPERLARLYRRAR